MENQKLKLKLAEEASFDLAFTKPPLMDDKRHHYFFNVQPALN